MNRNVAKNLATEFFGPIKKRIPPEDRKPISRPIRDELAWRTVEVACRSDKTKHIFAEAVGRKGNAQKQLGRAAGLCVECPMMYQCFEQSLLDKDYGMVRAGLPASTISSIQTALGAEATSYLAGLPPRDELREAFYERSSLLLGVLIGEVPLEEARIEMQTSHNTQFPLSA